jgi:hypothetical protein
LTIATYSVAVAETNQYCSSIFNIKIILGAPLTNVVTKDKAQEAVGYTKINKMASDYIWSISDLWCSREQCALRTEDDSNSAENNTEMSIVKFEHPAKSMEKKQTNELQRQ